MAGSCFRRCEKNFVNKYFFFFYGECRMYRLKGKKYIIPFEKVKVIAKSQKSLYLQKKKKKKENTIPELWFPLH